MHVCRMYIYDIEVICMYVCLTSIYMTLKKAKKQIPA